LTKPAHLDIRSHPHDSVSVIDPLTWLENQNVSPPASKLHHLYMTPDEKLRIVANALSGFADLYRPQGQPKCKWSVFAGCRRPCQLLPDMKCLSRPPTA
jgi:hypothetical protein